MEFTASLDTTAKVITTSVIVLFAGVIAWNIAAMKRPKGDKVNKIARFGVFLIIAVSLGVGFVFSTKGYETIGKSLIIKNRFSQVPLKWTDIADVRIVTPAEMSGLSRTLGVGGLFGYYGHYHNEAIGDMTFYATQQKNWVLLHTTSGEAIVITPDNPDKLYTEVKSIITPNN